MAAPPYDPYNQSLLYEDFMPKPAYDAYQTLVKQLTNYKYVRAITIPVGEVYVCNNPCIGEKMVAWGNNTSLTLNPAKTVEVTDYRGNITYIMDGGLGDEDGITNSSILVKLSKEVFEGDDIILHIPVFIRITSRKINDLPG